MYDLFINAYTTTSLVMFPILVFIVILLIRDLGKYSKLSEKIKVISAASIVAEVYRDNLMIKLSQEFSNYAWESNFGYGTKAHLEGLKKFGITSHHRKGFKPVHKILSN